MLKPSSHEGIGIICVILAGIGFAIKPIFIKITLPYNIPIDIMMLWRYVIALGFFMTFLTIRRKLTSLKPPSETSIPLILLAGFLGCYLSTYADYKALTYLDTAISRFILFTFPVFVVIITAFLERSRPPKSQILAMLIIQSGLYIMLLWGGNFGAISTIGILWQLAAAIIYGTYLLLIRRIGKNMSSVALSSWIISVAIVSAVASMTAKGLWSEAFNFAPEAWFWLILIGFFSTFLPIALLTEGILRIGAPRASLISSFGPFLSMILGYYFLHEPIASTHIIGGIVIVYGVLQLERKISLRRLFRRAI